MRAFGAFGVLALVSFAGALAACAGDAAKTTGAPAGPPTTSSAPVKCTADDACAGKTETPLCDVATGACVALPPGHEIGWRDGSAESVTLTVIYAPKEKRIPVDLAFHPDRQTELWVVNRRDDSVSILDNPGGENATAKTLVDPAASHFMHVPPAMAMGANNTWATCGDGNNGNNFMGPALFSADLKVFAKPATDLGSHLDMLHSSPFCRGIAHQEENIYWVFNSYDKSLDKCSFNTDHGPGMDDHSDGEIYRYATGQVLGTDNVPSHLAFSPEDGLLFAADTGNKRIVRLDTKVGTLGGTIPRPNEPLKARRKVDGTKVEDVVAPGTLEAPSGIELRGSLIYVSDHATSRFYAFDREGKTVRTLDTGLPASSLAGFTFGPDGKIYLVDMKSSRVLRIDPK